MNWIIILLMLLGCGKAVEVPVTPPPPVVPPPPVCEPQPIANAGDDKIIVRAPGYPSSVYLGAGWVEGSTYEWSPATSLSDAKVSHPIASPEKSTEYTLKVSNKCGVATDSVTVEVYSD